MTIDCTATHNVSGEYQGDCIPILVYSPQLGSQLGWAGLGSAQPDSRLWLESGVLQELLSSQTSRLLEYILSYEGRLVTQAHFEPVLTLYMLIFHWPK